MKKIKNLKVYMLLTTMLIGGCSHNQKDNASKVVESYVIEEPFFQKGTNHPITIEDIILTTSEKNINTKNETTQEIKDLLYNQLINNIVGKEAVERLHIEELWEKVLLSNSVTAKEEHTDLCLYIEETNSIHWEGLIDKIKENTLRCMIDNDQYLQDYISHIGKAGIYDGLYEGIEMLSDQDLQIWIEHLKEYTQKVQQDIPNLDIKRLACILSKVSVYYITVNPFDENDIKYVGTDIEEPSSITMIYPVLQGHYPDMKKFKQHNFHEFKHLFTAACKDEKDYLLLGTGIKISSNENHDGYYLPFGWDFIEESIAELYSNRLIGEKPKTYAQATFALHTLDFSNFLQKSYNPNNWISTSLLKNPIALLQQFPVPDEIDKEKEKEWYLANLKMLECYNITQFSKGLIAYLEDYEAEFGDDLDIEDFLVSIIDLQNYADIQLNRNFIWNLITANENREQKLSLEDSIALFQVFTTRIDIQRNLAFAPFAGVIDQLPNFDHFQEYYKNMNELFDYYLQYLYQEYPEQIVSIEDAQKKYQTYIYDEKKLLKGFTDTEKKVYNDSVAEVIEILKPHQPFEMEEEIKKFYKK